jgi:hypothetical protein
VSADRRAQSWPTKKAMINHALQFCKHPENLMRLGAKLAIMPDRA